MIKSSLVILFLAAMVVSLPAVSHAEGKSPAEHLFTPEQEAEMAAWMNLAQPGPHHEHLAAFVGTWKGEVTMWMAPGAEAMVEESKAEVSWILGGRFLEWKLSGEFAGMPFEGRAIEGYNNGDQRYEATWMDNFGTLILYYTGERSPADGRRKMEASFTDAVAGGTIEYMTLYTWSDPDHFTYTAYMDKGDGKFKSMEIKYTRQ